MCARPFIAELPFPTARGNMPGFAPVFPPEKGAPVRENFLRFTLVLLGSLWFINAKSDGRSHRPGLFFDWFIMLCCCRLSGACENATRPLTEACSLSRFSAHRWLHFVRSGWKNFSVSGDGLGRKAGNSQ